MILHTCSRTHTWNSLSGRSTQRSLSCRLRRILPSELYPLRITSTGRFCYAMRAACTRAYNINYRARKYAYVCVCTCARSPVYAAGKRGDMPGEGGGTISTTFQRRLKRQAAHMYRAVGEGRRWVKGDVGRGAAANGEGRGYSHVGIVWGTPRVNADAVGSGVEIRANINVTCKFSSAISLSLAKDSDFSRGKIFSRQRNKYWIFLLFFGSNLT